MKNRPPAIKISRLWYLVILAALSSLFTIFSAVETPAQSLGPHMDTGDTNPCNVCHDIASGEPALRGWTGGGVPTSGTDWNTKPISQLCYGCHDNSPGYLGTGASDMTAYAYSGGSHGYVVGDVPKKPEGSNEGDMADSGLPYVKSSGLECTSCHSVHNPQNRPFLQRADFQTLCDECHGGRINNAPLRGAANNFSGGIRSYSTHPTRQGLADVGTVNIKALADIDDNFKVAIAPPPNWDLGGHLDGADGTQGNFDCMTCHAVHGVGPVGGPPTLTDVPDLLALDNTTTEGLAEPSALCEGCHYGGDAGEQVGTTTISPGYSDHPLDSSNNLAAFYPAGAAIPDGSHIALDWTQGSNPNGDRGAQPFYGAGSGNTPVCSSCHDVHGGMANTALLRGPSYDGSSAVWTFSYDEWCFVCHLNTEVIPAGHHSSVNNWATSQLSCGDCHGVTANGVEWKAHNGFWNFEVAISETDSEFCEGCHSSTDPTDLVDPALKGQTLTEPADFPASHGTIRGTATHYLGPDSGEFLGVAPKVDAWPSRGANLYYSEYGPPSTGGGGDSPPQGVSDDNAEIICESCHNILYNDGRANPGSYTTTLEAGWESNLLLEPYEDDSPGTGDGSTGPYGVGSGLCAGCHDGSGFHHPLTGDVLSTSGLPLRTGSGSFADQAGAPGTLSYPDSNSLDCDGCHRPHQADDDSTVTASQHGHLASSDGRPTNHILEVDDSGHVWTPVLCSECHAR